MRKTPVPPVPSASLAEDPNAVNVSRARITKGGGDIYVEFTAPQPIFEELVQYVAKREHYKSSDLVEKHLKSPKVVDAMMKLSYLVEYCRRMDKKRLYIAGRHPDSAVVISLDELTRTPKYCFADGCNAKNSVVFCSLCNICCWCSEGCFAKSFETHTATICTMAQQHRKDLGL